VDSAGTHVAIPISEEAKEYLIKQDAEQYLKRVPESLHNKQLNQYDLIVTMEQKHRDHVLSRCPQCKDKIAVWNIEDPYFMSSEDAQKIYEQIRQKVTELAARTLR